MELKQVEKNCSICLTAINQTAEPNIFLPCGHRYHTRCIGDWQTACQRQGLPKSCPYCRRLILEQINYQSSEPSHRIALIQPVEDELPQENQKNLSFGQKIALFICSLIAIVASGGFLYFFISDCGDVLSSSGDYPFFSVGKNAKGYIAIGLAARGILTIGVFCKGIISFCVIGFGLLCFVGQVGGGLGFGIYQVGVSCYCFLGQLSISIWTTVRAQLGINLISPLIIPERQHFSTCSDNRC